MPTMESENKHSSIIQGLLYCVGSCVLAVLIYLYCGAALKAFHIVNLDMGRNDQSAYMDLSIKLVETDYKYFMPRNRMPLYPLLMTSLYETLSSRC